MEATMTTTRRRRIRWICPVTLAALVLAGCGTSGYTAGGGPASTSTGGQAHPSPSPALSDGIPAAAALTLTQRALIGWRLEGAQIFGHVHAPVYGQGPFDLATGRGSEVIDLPEIGHQEPGTEHAIFLPSQVYLQPKGGTLAVLPRGKLWLSAAIAGSDAMTVTQNFPQFVSQVEGVNPLLLLGELEWGTTRAVPLGPGRQIVDHVPAQRYRVSVSLTRALASATGPAAAALSEAIQEQLTAPGGGTDFDVQTWVDHDGRVVQMRANLPGTGEGTELLAVSYFGAKVHVTAPAPNQVVDITSLTPSGERENNGGGDTDGA
jgi:hypothetical protein